MSEREFVIKPPELPSTLSAEVRTEVEQLWEGRRPWSKIRELRKGVDASDGHCEGSQGEFVKDGHCPNKVEGVQYNIQGHPMYFCEKHALLQNEWDKIFYDSKPKETPPLTKEQEESIRKLLEKKPKRRKKDDVMEIDPAD
jgi:hypothetical protein